MFFSAIDSPPAEPCTVELRAEMHAAPLRLELLDLL